MLSPEMLRTDQETKTLIEELHCYLSPIDTLLDAIEKKNYIVPLKWPQGIPKPDEGKPNEIDGSKEGLNA